MEAITLGLGDDATYDRLVNKGRPDCPAIPHTTALHIATKDWGAVSGRATAVLSFEVQTPDGKQYTAQVTCTVRHLTMALSAIRGRYGDDGFAPDQSRN